MRTAGEPERMAGMMWTRFMDLWFVLGTGWFLGVAFETRRTGNKERFQVMLVIGLMWLGVCIFRFWIAR